MPLVRTFYLDLKRAELQTTATFEGVDFHALRATFATSLARADVPLVQAQRLMRHSDPRLTSIRCAAACSCGSPDSSRSSAARRWPSLRATASRSS